MKIDISKLKRYRALADKRVKEFWEGIQLGFKEKNPRRIESNVHLLVKRLRSRAILKYLVEGDKLGFFKDLRHSTTVTFQFNTLASKGFPCDREYYMLSESNGFFNGLLSGELADYFEIIEPMRLEVLPIDNMAVAYFVKALISGLKSDEEDFNDNIEFLESIQEVDGRDTTIEVDICSAIFSTEEVDLSESFLRYLNRRTVEIRSQKILGRGEEFISIEGLALIRFAKEVVGDSDFAIDHPLSPIDLQMDYPDNQEFPDRYFFCEFSDVFDYVDEPGYFDSWKR